MHVCTQAHGHAHNYIKNIVCVAIHDDQAISVIGIHGIAIEPIIANNSKLGISNYIH